jgi:hypothetical protein
MWYGSPSLLKLLDMANDAPSDSPRPLVARVARVLPQVSLLMLCDKP